MMGPSPKAPPEDPNENRIINTEELGGNHVVVQPSSSDTDEDTEEGINDGGYQLLPQEPTFLDQDATVDIEGVSHSTSDNVLQSTITPCHPPESEEGWASDDWSIPSCQQDNPLQSMDEDHIEKIKAAMSGFTLPPTAQPTWASRVPEDVWKQHLVAGAKSSYFGKH